MAGFLSNGVCYNTAMEAFSAHLGDRTLFVTPGATTYINQVIFDTATNAYRFMTYTMGSNGLWTLKSNSAMPIPAFPACDVIPQAVELAQAFGAGFILPMSGYVISYLVGRLVHMFDD